MTSEQITAEALSAYKNDFPNMLSAYQHIINVTVYGKIFKFCGMTMHEVVTSGGIFHVAQVKPILRHLSDMTHNEALEFICIGNETAYSALWILEVSATRITWGYHTRAMGAKSRQKKLSHEMKVFTPRQYSWLIRNQFDVFGLIDNGMAERK